MNEPRKAGRPKKHLENEHHFRTSEDMVVEDACPYVDHELGESDGSSTPDFANIEPIIEGVTVISSGTGYTSEPAYAKRYFAESLLEEKIQDLVKSDNSINEKIELNGWNSLDTEIILQQPPRNGMPIFLSEITTGEGTLGFWKRTRAFNGRRYDETGKWVNFQTGANIAFEPKYWKARF